MPRKKRKETKPKKEKPSFHEGLEGFDIKVNSFGQMESSFDIEQLNEFLNKEIDDKKLSDTKAVEEAEEKVRPKEKKRRPK
jgi:hypothetical protein